MTFELRARYVEEGNLTEPSVCEAEMRPGGGQMTLRFLSRGRCSSDEVWFEQGTFVLPTVELLESLLGMGHPTPEQIGYLADFVRGSVLPRLSQHPDVADKDELVEMLQTLELNLRVCLREPDADLRRGPEGDATNADAAPTPGQDQTT